MCSDEGLNVALIERFDDVWLAWCKKGIFQVVVDVVEDIHVLGGRTDKDEVIGSI